MIWGFYDREVLRERQTAVSAEMCGSSGTQRNSKNLHLREGRGARG